MGSHANAEVRDGGGVCFCPDFQQKNQKINHPKQKKACFDMKFVESIIKNAQKLLKLGRKGCRSSEKHIGLYVALDKANLDFKTKNFKVNLKLILHFKLTLSLA